MRCFPIQLIVLLLAAGASIASEPARDPLFFLARSEAPDGWHLGRIDAGRATKLADIEGDVLACGLLGADIVTATRTKEKDGIRFVLWNLENGKPGVEHVVKGILIIPLKDGPARLLGDITSGKLYFLPHPWPAGREDSDDLYELDLKTGEIVKYPSPLRSAFGLLPLPDAIGVYAATPPLALFSLKEKKFITRFNRKFKEEYPEANPLFEPGSLPVYIPDFGIVRYTVGNTERSDSPVRHMLMTLSNAKLEPAEPRKMKTLGFEMVRVFPTSHQGKPALIAAEPDRMGTWRITHLVIYDPDAEKTLKRIPLPFDALHVWSVESGRFLILVDKDQTRILHYDVQQDKMEEPIVLRGLERSRLVALFR